MNEWSIFYKGIKSYSKCPIHNEIYVMLTSFIHSPTALLLRHRLGTLTIIPDGPRPHVFVSNSFPGCPAWAAISK